MTSCVLSVSYNVTAVTGWTIPHQERNSLLYIGGHVNKQNFTCRDNQFLYKKKTIAGDLHARLLRSFIICHLHLVERQSEKKKTFFKIFFQGMVEMLVG